MSIATLGGRHARTRSRHPVTDLAATTLGMVFLWAVPLAAFVAALALSGG